MQRGDPVLAWPRSVLDSEVLRLGRATHPDLIPNVDLAHA